MPPFPLSQNFETNSINSVTVKPVNTNTFTALNFFIMKQTFKVSGMTCDGCVAIVHDRLAGIAGVKNVTVSLTNEQADIESEHPISADACNAALKGTIYNISPANNDSTDATPGNAITEKNKSLVTNYITAVAQKDYELIRKCVKNDFKFYGMINYQSADQFIQMLQEHAANPATDIVVKNDIKALFANDNEVYVIYDLLTKNNMSVPCMESIKISDGKITSTEIKIDMHRMHQLIQSLRKEKTQLQ